MVRGTKGFPYPFGVESGRKDTFLYSYTPEKILPYTPMFLYPYTLKGVKGRGYYPESFPGYYVYTPMPLYPDPFPGYSPESFPGYYPEKILPRIFSRILPRKDTTPKGYRILPLYPYTKGYEELLPIPRIFSRILPEKLRVIFSGQYPGKDSGQYPGKDSGQYLFGVVSGKRFGVVSLWVIGVRGEKDSYPFEKLFVSRKESRLFSGYYPEKIIRSFYRKGFRILSRIFSRILPRLFSRILPRIFYRSFYPEKILPRRGTGYSPESFPGYYPDSFRGYYPEKILPRRGTGYYPYTPNLFPDTTPKRYYPEGVPDTTLNLFPDTTPYRIPSGRSSSGYGEKLFRVVSLRE